MAKVSLKYKILIVVIFSLLCNSVKCQDEDEDDDEYDEEVAEHEATTATTTRRYRVRASTTVEPPASGRNESTAVASASSTGGNGTTLAENPSGTAAAPAAATTPPPLPPTRPPTRATTLSESQEEEVTEEEGYGYVFRPLNNLIDNIVAGNVTGIVDNALSIRTPPEIRQFVNNVMSNVFGAGFGTALRQFAPQLFTTRVPLTAGRDPIPSQKTGQNAAEPIRYPIDSPIIEARTNSTDAVKNKVPLQLKFTHPGAPASRLKCEIIAE